MIRIIVDGEVHRQLLDVTDTAELCDADGRILGRFLRQSVTGDWVITPPLPTDEELQELENSSNPVFTTAEVLAFLQRL